MLFHLLGQPFQFIDNDAAVRQPERQAGANFFVINIDFQFFAQFAMVTRLGFLEHLQVLLEFIRRLPGRTVDARQHLVVLIPAPVCAGDGHQLEGGWVDLAGGLDVRPAAQVREGIALVERDFRFTIQRVAIFVQPAFFQAVDQFQLVRLVLENLAGFVLQKQPSLRRDVHPR